jgi:surface antigen
MLFASIAPASAVAKSIHSTHARFYRGHHRYYGGVIQCVAFAKQDAGIALSGNARDWWSNAAGVYERGRRPEEGSVLSFSANGRMPLGHVAVVSGVQDSRTITIDQAHWAGGGISRDVVVKDVSEDNDWTAVRVELGHGGGFGSIYPTHGFIYPRPDRGVIVQASTYAPMPNLDTPPADLRHGARHLRGADEEVAEAPATRRGLDLSIGGLGSDAPDRAFQ